MTTELARTVPELLEAHPAVHNIRLVGSRADGKPGPLSDWDFAIDCDSGGAVVWTYRCFWRRSSRSRSCPIHSRAMSWSL